MTQKKRNPAGLSRARRKRQRNRRMFIAGGCVLLSVILVITVVLLVKRPKEDREVFARNTPSVAPSMEASEVTPEPSATPAPVRTPKSTADPRYLAMRPVANEGWLPVFKKMDTTEKIIAITIDDCYQASNLTKIIQSAIENDGKLTIFPIGNQALRSEQSKILKAAWENGMEIENHTFTHNGLFNCTDEQLASEVMLQNYALSKILNVEYTVHFLRPMGGDAHADQRIHAYAMQLGYKGIAHWSVSGSGTNIATLKKGLKPGDIYLFHTTDSDMKKLLEFIPYAASQGYKLVTLNEMFGYPENETSPLLIPVEQHDIPPLEAYDIVLVDFKKGNHAYGIFRLQERLSELGYTVGEADGIFGDGTASAIRMFQQRAGLEATGVADVLTQQMMYESQAPRAS